MRAGDLLCEVLQAAVLQGSDLLPEAMLLCGSLLLREGLLRGSLLRAVDLLLQVQEGSLLPCEDLLPEDLLLVGLRLL